MKYSTVAASVIASLGLFASGAHAAGEAGEFAQIREQLQNLLNRVDRLEQENNALKAENVQLKSRTETIAKESAEAKSADWPSRIALKGDVRYRHQQIDDERAAAERDVHVLRVRVNMTAKVNDAITAGVGLTTTQGGNPRAGNVSLDGEFSRKELFLDLGYIDWRITGSLHAIGGKMKMPFERPGQSLFWDNDINPEGIAFTYANGSLFGSAYGFWIEENVQYAPTASSVTDTTDTKLFGLQIGNRFKLGSGDLTLAATYNDLASAKGRRPYFSNASGNSVSAPNGGLAYDFEMIGALAEFSTKMGTLPLTLWLDYAHNRAADLNNALNIGALLGKALSPGTWETGLSYQFIEKDALFAQVIDSDFAGGVSDNQGWVARFGYAPLKNWYLGAAYYMAKANVDRGTEYDYDRLLLDVSVKF